MCDAKIANDVCEDTADCEDAEGWDFNIGEDSATLNGNKDEAIACFRVEATTSDSTIMNVQYVKVTVSITENGDFSAISMSLADSHAWTDNAVAKTISNTLNVDIAQCSGGDPDMGDWVSQKITNTTVNTVTYHRADHSTTILFAI